MTAARDQFDPRAQVLGVFNLCNIHTRDGAFGFLPGVDGVFTDVNGKKWYGSTLANAGGIGSAINGSAPEGSVSLEYFQDPSIPDLIGQIKALGRDYIEGRKIEFFWQPFTDVSEMMAPKIAPQLYATRIMRSVTKTAGGGQDRSITVTFEAWTEDRRAARRISLDTRGHAKLIGRENPSLEFMPRDNFDEEKLFG